MLLTYFKLDLYFVSKWEAGDSESGTPAHIRLTRR